MTKTFNCPSCGAPLDYDGGDDPTLRCPFCNSSVIVPPELRTGSTGTPPTPTYPQSNTLGQLSPASSNLAGKMQEIQRLIQVGNKIEAIKVYRQATSAGLKEAKDVIDRLAEGKGIQVSTYTVRLGEAGVVSDVRADKIREIGRLLQAGNKIEAIKVYRETFNLGLKEAKDAVEKLATTVDTPDAFEMYPVEINPAGAIDRHPARPTTMAAANFEPVGASSGGCARVLVLGLIALVVLGLVGAGLWFLLNGSGGENQIAALINAVVATATPLPTDTPPPSPTSPPTETPVPTPTPEFAGRVLSFGEEGNGPGQFNDARAVGADGAGNIYVGEYSSGRVQVFDAEGKFVTQWKFGGKQTFLSAMTVDREGTVYAVLNGNIERYNGATGESLGPINYINGQGFQSVAVLPGGGLVASWNKDWAGGLFTNFSESQDDIVSFDREGNVTTVIPQALSVAAGGAAELDTIIAVDGDGAIYAVGDLNGNVVFKFSADGKFLDRFNLDAASNIQALTFDNQNHLYVAGSQGILVYDTDGRYIDTFDTDTFASGLAVNVKDELFAIARTQVIKYLLSKR